ncbi:MAG: histone deacetylase [Planctomycetota bacterium]
MTLLYADKIFVEHDTGPMHPECPERAVRIWKRLTHKGLDNRCQKQAIALATKDQVLSVHSPAVFSFAEQTCHEGGGYLDGDTPVSSHSLEVALYAAGTGIAAVDAVMEDKDNNAFCLVRPPGHHATPSRSMGFCLFNNIAIAAKHAITKYELNRVLIVDWDVHHGNGTQDVFYADPQVMFFSAHRFPFYPGSGRISETGTQHGLGYTVNLPVRYGTSRHEYQSGFLSMLEKAAEKIRPELVLISAGFDAHALDPVGSLGLESEDFGELSRLVLQVADVHASGRCVSMLEGGYHLEALAEGVEIHLRELLAASKHVPSGT